MCGHLDSFLNKVLSLTPKVLDSAKAFRAYMQPTVANARAMNYRMGGTTAIDDAQLTNDNEVTVVGIYTLGGVRISEMQEGVNILQMSDGSVVKVVIK